MEYSLQLVDNQTIANTGGISSLCWSYIVHCLLDKVGLRRGVTCSKQCMRGWIRPVVKGMLSRICIRHSWNEEGYTVKTGVYIYTQKGVQRTL